MRSFIVLIALLSLQDFSPDNAWAQSCQGKRQEPLFSLEGRVISAFDGCFLAADVNNGKDMGYSYSPQAGAQIGATKIKDSIDAYNFLAKCLSQKGVYQPGVGVDSAHPDFEGEVARCNSELFGEDFVVKRYQLPFGGMSPEMLYLANFGQIFDCYVMLEFSFLPAGGGHAVGVRSALSRGNEFSFEVTDGNFPDEPKILTGEFRDKSFMVRGEEYQKLMGLRGKIISLRAMVFECPLESAFVVDEIQ